MSETIKELDSVIDILSKATIQQKSESIKKDNNKNDNKHDTKNDIKKISHEIDEKYHTNIDNDTSIKQPGTDPLPDNLTIEERLELCKSIAVDIVTEDDFRQLFLTKKTRPIAYDGFEPSGRMHIAQGILKSVCVNKLTTAGCDFIFWVADWFALLNNKMDGDLSKIRIVGEYMIEVWKAAGMDMNHVYFKWASDEINKHANEYWLRVINISRAFSITRTKRCCTIMGRQESDDMPTANLLYAAMQCADIFFLKADICQLGNDQRKVNMLAREYSDKENGRKLPPIVIGHPMMSGLKEGQEKMSKSAPDSAIFMEDSAEDVNRKIKRCYCPPQIVKDNPCINYCKLIVFPKYNQLEVKRKPSDGGDIVYHTISELEKDFAEGKLHPGDLKPALARTINSMLEPVRQHFANDPKAKQLLAKVKKFRVSK